MICDKVGRPCLSCPPLDFSSKICRRKAARATAGVSVQSPPVARGAWASWRGEKKKRKKERVWVGGWLCVCVCERERERERKRPEYARWRERERQAANKELTYAPASTAQHIEGRMNAIQVQITK